jgi:hypothetical protein
MVPFPSNEDIAAPPELSHIYSTKNGNTLPVNDSHQEPVKGRMVGGVGGRNG